MSRQIEIDSYRRNSALFMSILAAQVSVLGQENWESLPRDTHDDSTLPILGGFTHKDYLDGAAVWAAITDENTLLKFVVMKEGFNQGFGQLRDAIANTMGETLPLSRKKPSRGEILNIQNQRNQDAAIVMYPTGNRNLLSDLHGGIQLTMRKRKKEEGREDDKDGVMYPFINLSDTAPAFPSGSTLGQNVGELLQRTLLARNLSTEFLYLMKPITKLDLDLMKEGKKSKLARDEVLGKLEVLRAYGVLKTFLEISKATNSAVNPLLGNSDNIPLLVKSQKMLSDNLPRVMWLIDQGYFLKEEVSLLLSLPFSSK